jgi:phasin family protein
MFKTNDQFAAANQAAVSSLMTVATGSLDSAERLAALNLNTARAIMEDGAAAFGALFAAKDPQALVALQAKLAKPAAERAMAYSRSVYEILSQSSNGLTQIAEVQAAEIKKNFNAAIDQSLKNAPAGSEAVVTAVKSAIAAADSAYNNMAKAAKQASETMEANVASANAATLKLISKAA